MQPQQLNITCSDYNSEKIKLNFVFRDCYREIFVTQIAQDIEQ